MDPEVPAGANRPEKNFVREYLENAPADEIAQLEELAELDREGPPPDAQLPERKTG